MSLKHLVVCLAVCGTASSAYKKWEKAAIAGVSLVADAAEHLERTSNDKNGGTDMLPPSNCTTSGKFTNESK